ncbi:efflux RND transporter permease subunit [Kordiimonas laminariae]|uniref:efflux RND transporter permease subunit n=1 Tax=Kordiimonas laminariae TaxID=2917717 RepID=UPI001FF55067|nr:efflux RND transporter permease subunit [Kordiimonas laminariae]MCK0070630.1 efflux RND transporter permease subunit [Kordiimonas laminariae]
MKGLIKGALENRVAATLFAFVLIMAGLLSLQTLNARLFPEIIIQGVTITVPYPGATPTEVETSIVKPIEERLEGMEGVRKITALAATGVASVLVDIEDGESIPDMLDDIQTEINRITVFPQRSERPQVVHTEQDELIALLIIYGDKSVEELKRVAERVRSDLTDLDEISRAAVNGAPPYLIDISISENTLQSLGLSLGNISDRIGEQSLDLSGGEIENNRQKLLVRSTGERRTGDQFRNVVLGSGETGTPILLEDVADINDGISEAPIQAIYKGKPATFVTVFRTGDEQILDLANAVRGYFAEDIQGVLPEGIETAFWRDEASILEQRMSLLSENAILGLILVFLLLMAFLDIRIAGWVAFGVTVAFVGSFTLMSIFGVTINMLTLFGFILAIGIVVDDAIVVGENIHGTWRNQGVTPKEAAKIGVLRVSTPVLFSVTTTIVAFVPLLFLPGTFGQFLGPIAAVVICVLVLSLFDSFFILPKHLSHLRVEGPRRFSPRKIADPFRNWFASRLRRFTEGPIRRAVTTTAAHPLATVLVAFGIFMGSMSLLTGGVVKVVFFPAVEGDYITAELELSEATSKEQTLRYADYIAKAAEEAAKDFELDDDPLRGVFTSLGRTVAPATAAPSTDGGAASNKAYIELLLKDASSRNFSTSDFEKLWREKVGEIPGAQKLTFTADLVSPGAPIQLEVSTRLDSDTRSAVAEIVRELKSLPGVYDVRDDRFRTTDEVQISLKPLARSYGISQEDLAREIRATFFGAEVTRVQRDREEIQVRVRLPKQERLSVEAMKNLRIRVGDGFIPVTSLADINIEPAPAAINRINSRRVYTVSGYVDTALITAGEATNYILNEVLPREAENFDGLHITLSGNQEEQAKTVPAIARNFMMAMMVIYTLLALSFKSYSQPVIVMMAIPFGFMGALIGHGLLGMDMTLLSMFGVIGLSGVIINNSLMVVSFINDRIAEGEEYHTAVVESVLERFRAILLTTLTTFLGVTPIILETSVQAQFLVPTAVSLGFGIIIGTSVLIFTIPALSMMHLKVFGHHSRRGKKKAVAAAAAE